MTVPVFLKAALALAVCLHVGTARADDTLRALVDRTILPLKEKHRIPGLSVALTIDGKAHVFHYGVASLATGAPVNDATLYELGSISKTYTVLLATLAEQHGKLAMTDRVEQHLPQLRGSAFGGYTLLDLATNASSGLPMQVPPGIDSDANMIAFLRSWTPLDTSRPYRTYSNISIGMLGKIGAQHFGAPFAQAAERQLFAPLGLKSTFVKVPLTRIADYAQGYADDFFPARVHPAQLSDEAYGVKSSAPDLLRFLQIHLGQHPLEPAMQRAVARTQAGVFTAGPMVQSMIWERYTLPATLAQLSTSSTNGMSRKPVPVEALPAQTGDQIFMHKTGSTNGFAAYAAFAPARRMGIVILANHFYPNDERVRAAHEILTNAGL